MEEMEMEMEEMEMEENEMEPKSKKWIGKVLIAGAIGAAGVAVYKCRGKIKQHLNQLGKKGDIVQTQNPEHPEHTEQKKDSKKGTK